ncbi:WEB family protein [Carex littledalei]|uniref:WEB family protein n=1 Tax=Carex littledalei TaxID=544730 RepID=A0A833R6V3_9POAL|nr:WEB family protein [Carex littledalei]
MAERGEVDTSSQFVSVKEAVNHFGGSAATSPVVPWRPNVGQFHLRPEEIELMKVEEETVKFEMELFVKERETVKVLRELEVTKQRIDNLNLELEKGTFHNKLPLALRTSEDKFPVLLRYKDATTRNMGRQKSPNSTLIELQQAKVNLNRNTAQILKNKVEEERLLMEKTREKIRLKTAKATTLEQDLNKTISEIEHKKVPKLDIQAQIKQASSEQDKHLEMKEVYKSEISNLIAEIEEVKSRTKIVQVRVLVAQKMKEASNTAEALALSEIKTQIDAKSPSTVNTGITLSPEDHAELIHKAQKADAISRKKIETAMKEVEEARKSKRELLEKVEEAMTDVETSRKALNNALKREAIATKRKLESEEALRRWRCDHYGNDNYHKNTLQSLTKFKNSVATPRKGGPALLDVNGLSLVKSKPEISIGQILNMKLMGPQERERRVKGKNNTKPKVSLGQILSQSYEAYSPFMIDDSTRQSKAPNKRKKLGLVIFTLLLAKKKTKKKQGFSSQGSFSKHKSA